jgi:hypothetical protein
MLSRITKGKDPTFDLAIFETQMLLQRTYNRSFSSHADRIQKFMELDDALDGMEAMIMTKIKLGLKEWGEYYDMYQKQLRDPDLPYTNFFKYKFCIKQRYTLLCIVLQSLGFSTVQTMENQDYESSNPQNTINQVR